ncbi:MAG TPA: hypothetical protein VEW07_13465 [Solirubrobacterales bacterium]|nr:hypothetical protein [Solirubrobacterales bacterium]
MREKINGDPRFQIGIVVVLIAVAAFMFLKPGGEEEGEEVPTEATVAIAGTEASGTATGTSAGEAVEGAVEGAIEAATAEASTAAIAGSVPVPPMPAPVAHAYDAGKTVVLLVVHDGGIDDKLVQGAAQQLKAHADVALFVVPAKQIARYAAITLGADVQQVPALVAMKPRRLSEGVPQASVDYGFQTSQSIVQAVIDAGYKGPEETYHPD